MRTTWASVPGRLGEGSCWPGAAESSMGDQSQGHQSHDHASILAHCGLLSHSLAIKSTFHSLMS